MTGAAAYSADDADALSDLIGRLRAGDIRTIARTISELERQSDKAPAILKALQPHLGRGLTVGFTGPPGAGKSTLISAFITALRKAGKTVGVVAVDPSSPISGGSILGDRIRMSDHAGDDGVFVRSVASRGALGGLTPAAIRMIDVMDAAGRDIIVLETVGAGQSEVEISEIADIKVVICAPGLGDDIQAMKSGILEIADILVVNKADLPGANQTVRQLRSALGLRTAEAGDVDVLSTCATDGTGVEELAAAIAKIGEKRSAEDIQARRRRRARRLLEHAAADLIKTALGDPGNARIAALCDAILNGDMNQREAAETLLRDWK